MKSEFVPYDIALAMKELGFNESCFGYYLLEDECFMDVRIRRQGEALCLAPLYQQAFRWFREKHNIDTFPSKTYNYYFAIYINGELYEESNGIKPLLEGETFEEAQNACLRKLIEIVKESKG